LNKPELDPEDQFLVSDTYAIPGQSTNGHGTPSGTPGPAAHIPWLRKTEYITREGSHRSSAQESCVISLYHFFIFDIISSKSLDDVAIDVSRAAQIRDIEATFPPSNVPIDLSFLKHPNNPNVTAVESYEMLPDSEIWANAYDLFKFSERPGERPAEVRLCPILSMIFF